MFRIALANLRYPATPEESVSLAEQAVTHASVVGASLVCFPECFVPGYRGLGKSPPPPDPGFLQRAWSAIGAAAAEARLTVILGTERVADGALLARPSQNRRSHGLNWGRGFLRLRTPTCCRKATSSSPRSVASGRRHRTKKEKPGEAGSWAQFTRRSAPERGRQGAGQDGLRLFPLFTSERPVMLTFN